jgi:hypothetical protein
MNVVLFSLALTVLPIEGNCPPAFQKALHGQLEQIIVSNAYATLSGVQDSHFQDSPHTLLGRLECSQAPVLRLTLQDAEGEVLRTAKTDPSQDFTPAVEQALAAMLQDSGTGRPWLFGGVALSLAVLWGAFQFSQGGFR